MCPPELAHDRCMNVIFAGTPEFAAVALQSILGCKHRVVLVLTQPDRPAGRGMKLQQSPVKRLAEANGLDVLQPASLKEPQVQARLRSVGADAMIVAAYGLILPQAVLDMWSRGAINIHGSLLPRWRGAAPIQRALLAGDTETGICIMQMDAGLDTGPVLLREAIKISADDDAQSLHDKLAVMGARMIVNTLDELDKGVDALPAQAQPAEGATYASKLEKSEARIDWNQPAESVDRQVRAFRPFPGAGTSLTGGELKIWRVRIVPEFHGAEPGTIVQTGATGFRVACGCAAVDILELQKAGGRRVSAADFLRGTPLTVGAKLGD